MSASVMGRTTNRGRLIGQGANLLDNGVRFRVWAPQRRSVEVLLGDEARSFPMTKESDGHWSTHVETAKPGMRYRYRLDGEAQTFPDPGSRFQPQGPHGPSEIVDPSAFIWSDQDWTGVPLHGQVLYELHVGTFSPDGTWRGAIQKLPSLKEVGITVLEVMPVAEFPGTFGWGYDGVDWFAPSHLYGSPDDFRAFVNEAHRLGLGVILDVVYNHFGPDGNYLTQFSPHYFSDQTNEWGTALNFDGPECGPVRRLVADNAAYWIDEFHLDGLRLDATQCIHDRSSEHVITLLAREAREAAGRRRLLIIAENEPQDANLLRSTAVGGSALDALWNDDFHHSVTVALTGRRQAYYSDYKGTANEWLAAISQGFMFQGQRSAWQSQRRGHPARGLPSASFVAFIDNHDQVANSLWSLRTWQQSNPSCYRAITALLLLGPWTPLMFQGQEWNATTPFFYFADHKQELAKLVRAGRADFMSQFPGCASERGRELLRDPASGQIFQASRLRWEERAQPIHERALRMHTDLLRLRRSDPTLGLHAATGLTVVTAALSPTCAVVRYFVDGPVSGAQPHDRLLIVNLGCDLEFPTIPEPLLAPPLEPTHSCWRLLWTSEDPMYGGWGIGEPESEERGWRIPGACAVLLGPMPRV